MITFTIPLKVTNPLNGSQGRSRAAMFGKAARRKKERGAAWAFMKDAMGRAGLGPLGVWRFCPLMTVTMTRLSPGTLDTDGLQAALKSVRDGIADALETGDGAGGPTFEYEQRKVKRGQFGVEVSIG